MKTDSRLDYYQREISYLRESGKQFSAHYPKVAGRLDLSMEASRDPHIERMIESFAFLTSRVRQEMDDERERVADMILSVVHPQLSTPLPAISIAQFNPAKVGPPTHVPRGHMLVSEGFNGKKCHFQTCFDVDTWPLEIFWANLLPADQFDGPLPSQNGEVLHLKIRLKKETPEAPPAKKPLPVQQLRIHLEGESRTTHALHEMLFCHLEKTFIRVDGGPLQAHKLRPQPVGFSETETVLPHPENAHPGLGLLQEYFAFPEKFLFFDLEIPELLGARENLELFFCLKPSRYNNLEISRDMFQLACTPVINLFRQRSEPIRTGEYKLEYPVVPDQYQNDSIAVHSILSVSTTDKKGPNLLQPYLGSRHHEQASQAGLYWLSHREHGVGTSGYDSVTISLVDDALATASPVSKTLYADTLCTNRNLPEGLLPGNPLFSENSLPGMDISLRRKPTRQVAPPQGDNRHLLVSALSLNYLSIVSGEQGLSALKTLLKLYNFEKSEAASAQVDGICGLISRPALMRMRGNTGSKAWPQFSRGIEVELTFDEENFAGDSAFLLASVLNRFFPMYAAINTPTQLMIRRKKDQTIWKLWPPRCGKRILL